MSISKAPLGYKTGVKNAVVRAIRELYPKGFTGESGAQDVNVNIEYPVTQGEYPAIMVEFLEREIKAMSIGGKALEETTEPEVFKHIERWGFDGTIKVSFYAMKAKQRDMLSDGFIRAIGFGDDFRDALWQNPYIAIDANTKQMTSAGESVSPGTPWGSDELTYFSAYNINVRGEFFTDSATAGIIDRVEVHSRIEGEPDSINDSQGVEWV